MKNRKNIIILVLIAVLLVLTCFIFFFFDSPITGNIVLGSYIDSGYSSPAGIFSLTPEYFELNTVNQIVSFDASVVNSGGYIYNQGYFWNARLGQWVGFNFPGETVAGSNWIANSASLMLDINATNNLQNGMNYYENDIEKQTIQTALKEIPEIITKLKKHLT